MFRVRARAIRGCMRYVHASRARMCGRMLRAGAGGRGRARAGVTRGRAAAGAGAGAHPPPGDPEAPPARAAYTSPHTRKVRRTLPPIMPRAPAPKPPANGIISLLNQAAQESLSQTGEVVAMLETLRRTSPRDYIAAMVMIARLNVDVPSHEREYTVISAIPRSKLDETPAHMAPGSGTQMTTVN